MGNHKGDYSLLNTLKNLSEATYFLSIKYLIYGYIILWLCFRLGLYQLSIVTYTAPD